MGIMALPKSIEPEFWCLNRLSFSRELSISLSGIVTIARRELSLRMLTFGCSMEWFIFVRFE